MVVIPHKQKSSNSITPWRLLPLWMETWSVEMGTVVFAVMLVSR